MSFCIAKSQSQIFAGEAKAALYIHDTASVASSEFKSLEAFDKLIKKYPSEWLPPFWASYICTQISRLTKDPSFPKTFSGKVMIEKSQLYLDKSTEIKGIMTDIEKADFHALQGLIYDFLTDSSLVSDKDKGKNFNVMRDKEFKSALALDPLEFNLLVYFAISLMTQTSAEFKRTQSALSLLDYAKKESAKITNRALTTYWSVDFIDFWKSNAANKLKKQVGDSVK